MMFEIELECVEDSLFDEFLRDVYALGVKVEDLGPSPNHHKMLRLRGTLPQLLKAIALYEHGDVYRGNIGNTRYRVLDVIEHAERIKVVDES